LEVSNHGAAHFGSFISYASLEAGSLQYNFAVDVLSIVLVVGLIGGVALFFGVMMNRSKDENRLESWKEIVSLIHGTDKRGKISGTYQGRSVEVFLSNHGYELDIYFYYLRLKVPIQGFDWTIVFDKTSFLDPTKRWQIKTDNEALKQRLKESGAVELIKQEPGHPKVSYRADKGSLEYESFAHDDTYVPARDEFQRHLNLMTQLAELNEKTNVW
jgi:hypothetical protein